MITLVYSCVDDGLNVQPASQIFVAQDDTAFARAERDRQRAAHRKRFQLYKAMTGIQWDEEAADDAADRCEGDDRVKGFVALERLAPFDFRIGEETEDAVRDQLWAKIEVCAGVDVENLKGGAV